MVDQKLHKIREYEKKRNGIQSSINRSIACKTHEVTGPFYWDAVSSFGGHIFRMI